MLSDNPLHFVLNEHSQVNHTTLFCENHHIGPVHAGICSLYSSFLGVVDNMGHLLLLVMMDLKRRIFANRLLYRGL